MFEVITVDYERQILFIRVTVTMDETGFMVPIAFRLPNGKQYKIDIMRSFRDAGPDRACYTVEVEGRELHLFFQKNPPIMFPQVGRWYLVKY